ncbi:MAG: hypothetical protein EXX96DRAFT_381121 [Benjaminiella poitrasii]|nr:MAG: hypothetical protein EXX96DRAFT_381121 [Benjaminiella poitrasii]
MRFFTYFFVLTCLMVYCYALEQLSNNKTMNNVHSSQKIRLEETILLKRKKDLPSSENLIFRPISTDPIFAFAVFLAIGSLMF